MFPDVSYLFNYLFGTPVDNALSIFKTFGLFLVLAFFTSAFIFKKELVRKRSLGLFKARMVQVDAQPSFQIAALILNGLFGFILGWKLPLLLSDTSSFSQSPTALLFSMEGNWILALVIALVMMLIYYWMSRNNKEEDQRSKLMEQYPEHLIVEITMLAAFFGVLGAKLFSIFENWEAFVQAPFEQLFAGNGLTIYGGLILAFVMVYVYIKRLNFQVLHIMDAVAPALIMGYVVGRLGCHMSGDGDWGIIASATIPNWFVLPDWMWAFDYPHNVVNTLSENAVLIDHCGGVQAVGGAAPIYCTKLEQAVYPTPIYEVMAGSMIFFILWSIRKRIKIAGMLFFIYLVLNGMERFFIEQIRVNERYDIFGLNWSLSQGIAFGLMLMGVFGLLYLKKYGQLRTDQDYKSVKS